MKSSRIIIVLIAVLMSSAASAGLIRDGVEWELRGTPDTRTNNATAAALDTTNGWTWASSADFALADFFLSTITDPDWSLFLGVNDGTGFDNADAWLSDPVMGGAGVYAVANLFSGFNASAGSYKFTGGALPGIPFPRLSFRAVPEPTTLALMGLGLAGVGFSRRKTR